jgi:hypothetical protein
MRTAPRIVALSFTAVSLVVTSACGGSESDRDEPKIKNVAISNTTVNAGPTTSYATGLNKSPMPTSAIPMIPQTTAVQKATPASVFTATTTTKELAKPASSNSTVAPKVTTKPQSTTTTVAKKTTKKKKKPTK